ncbi:hypothetical protein CVT24_007819 [Panaeolus cyanescens]|uniref:CUE domain-containing protein n=1 Tax=Panaeolus cyanescens TaxID=181874 RepID=A0A409W4N2_9AGAR|nr:hypothetical protein CVT24_007819 [Panaeolus cyanescens]
MRLPGYPSPAARKALSPSQSASLYQNISNALANVLELPPEKRDANSTYNFLATYANYTATEVLDGWIWPENRGILKLENSSKDEQLVRKRVLLLAEKIAMSRIQGEGGLDLQTLLDLSVIYSRTNPSKLRDIFKAVAESRFSASLVSDITRELVPGFIRLLSSPPPDAQGLYAQRKVVECITAFLRGAKNCSEFIRPFFDTDDEDASSPFILAVAHSYEDGLARMATVYGGLGQLNRRIASLDPRDFRSASSYDDADDWQRIWIETKVTLLDAFHIVFITILDDIAAAPAGMQLASKGEKAFALVFKLLEGGNSSSSGSSSAQGGSSSIPPTPYLNCSLLTDYNGTHPVETTLSRVLKKADERDVRLDLLESSLATLKHDHRSDPGALKLLLHSAGLPIGAGKAANLSSQPSAAASGPRQLQTGEQAAAPSKLTLSAEEELEITLKSSQILDILPETPNTLIRKLLLSSKYGGDPERVLGALLEGAEGVGIGVDAEPAPSDPIITNPTNDYDVSQRRNVFDDHEFDPSQVRVGKRAESASLADRSFMEQMKADILRRAEAISDSEDESDLDDPFAEHKEDKKGKGKQAADLDDEDICNETPQFHVRDAGGEDDSADEDLSADEDEEEQETDVVVTPEIMIEMAYVDDATVFQRDANTRRSKARKELKEKTGWDDGQIESWAIMVERDPSRKQKLIDRHTGSLSFKGNVKGMHIPSASGSGQRGGRGGRGRGGGGRGRGRGGGSTGGSDPNSARERAWKDKNKASRANHNRKRGHDKKMAKAGAGVPPGG